MNTNLRSFLAVFTGLVLIGAISHGVDAALQASGVFPAFGANMSDAMFAAAAVYRTLLGFVGCYVTARLAPRRPQLHALILGGIGTLISTVGVIATWDHAPDLGPHWYALSLVATALPAAWLAAQLHQRNTFLPSAA